MQQLAAAPADAVQYVCGIAHVQPKTAKHNSVAARIQPAYAAPRARRNVADCIRSRHSVHSAHGPQADKNLPPLSEDVPDPNAAQLIESIIGVFHSNIWKRFPKDNDKNDRSN